jgi:hypothetical protein
MVRHHLIEFDEMHDEDTMAGLCNRCRGQQQPSLTELYVRVRDIESRLQSSHAACASCITSAPAEPIQCESLDCPEYYSRKRAEQAAEASFPIMDLIRELEEQAQPSQVEEDEAPTMTTSACRKAVERVTSASSETPEVDDDTLT